MAHPDELLFQVEHQAFELWFKVVLQEFGRVSAAMREGKALEAATLLQRCTRILRLLTDQLLILETMPPMDFHAIRLKLGRGSGSESPGFRAILMQAPKLWKPFAEMLDRRKVALIDVYKAPSAHYEAFRLAEALTDFDMYFQIWRLNHLTFIKRVIGRDVKSLKGYSVHALEDDVKMLLFPPLWAVRNELTTFTGTSPA
jgi:tryptophan 2,3-dioxygenase